MMVPLESLLHNWRSDPGVHREIAAWRTFPERQAFFQSLPPDLHPELVAALSRKGIKALYSHQTEAWRLTIQGKHVAIVTGTASGKTLAYNLPVVDRLLRDQAARALYIFPTKALAQDQVDALRELPLPGQEVSVYDGDTPASIRPAVRSQARVVITNPDMLHTGILPHHTAWHEFFRNLSFIVIDEIHVYRGVFGSHLANVIRRLKRIAHSYGAVPRFILTSATIGNPSEHARRLVEEEVATIEFDGSARGEQHFLIYNPPIVDRELGLRRSALQEGVRLADDLLAHDVQLVIFGRSRRTVELVLSYLRERFASLQPAVRQPGGEHRARSAEQAAAERIRGYRSGYLPGQRREIERGLRRGQVRAVVATNALELGIDIGGMGAALMVGFPGTISAAWQQAGRAGRGLDASLAVLVATADPLDQYLAHHPDYFFSRTPELALIDPDNLLILLAHLRCAAFELPFNAGDGFGWLEPARTQEILEFLRAEGQVHASGKRYFWMADRYPAQDVSLRSASPANVVLLAGEGESLPGEEKYLTIGQVDRVSAPWMVHPQAIYLHEGSTFLVEDLDLELNVAYLRRSEVDYYTEPRNETSVELVERYDQEKVAGGWKAYGKLLVTSRTVGYRKVRWFTHETLGYGEVSLPPTELLTTGYWLSLEKDTVSQLREAGTWRNDPNDYGPNWEGQRQLARLRDGFRCQVCSLEEAGRSHDIHHKIPFRKFPSYREANQLENLVTLCPACHQRVETAVRVRSGLAGLAFVLGHLAPLYLMCDLRDLGIHSDPQSPLADEQPTVVVYDQVPAGIGFSHSLYQLHSELTRRASELISSCECVDGCPSCVGPGGENGLGGKKETLALLAELIR